MNAAMVVRRGCTCPACVGCCTHIPGWFAPGEAEKAAEFVGTPFGVFSRASLIEEYWCDGPVVWSPRKVGQTGRRATWSSAFGSGRCVFLRAEDRCGIYPVRPMECREAFGCRKTPHTRARIVKLWEDAGEPLGNTRYADDE